jgi:hypothetical protein
MAGDINTVLTQGQSNRSAAQQQSIVTCQDNWVIAGNRNSVKVHLKRTEQLSRNDLIFLEIDADKFIKYLKDLDPNKYLPLPLNLL